MEKGNQLSPLFIEEKKIDTLCPFVTTEFQTEINHQHLIIHSLAETKSKEYTMLTSIDRQVTLVRQKIEVLFNNYCLKFGIPKWQFLYRAFKKISLLNIHWPGFFNTHQAFIKLSKLTYANIFHLIHHEEITSDPYKSSKTLLVFDNNIAFEVEKDFRCYLDRLYKLLTFWLMYRNAKAHYISQDPLPDILSQPTKLNSYIQNCLILNPNQIPALTDTLLKTVLRNIDITETFLTGVDLPEELQLTINY